MIETIYRHKNVCRLRETFERVKKESRAALIGYITAGDPDPERSLEILDAACDAGLDVLEFGIPFSDPSADGPVIRRACNRAIHSGMTLEKGFELIRRIRERHDLPIIILSYFSPVLTMGTGKFVRKALEAGADGALVVDLPNEYVDEILRHVDSKNTFSLIRLLAPAIDPSCRRQTLREAKGFVYVVSRQGVTGTGRIDWNVLSDKMNILRTETILPLCIGFGISTPEDVHSAAGIADGAIVGSAIQKIIEEQADGPFSSVTEFIKTLRKATFKRSYRLNTGSEFHGETDPVTEGRH